MQTRQQPPAGDGSAGPSALRVDPTRQLVVYTFGKTHRLLDERSCDLTFDLTSFHTEYNQRDSSREDGRSEAIQQSMRSHPGFDALMASVVAAIERREPKAVAFMCVWGKHRSVAWAEILKRDHYPHATIKHVRLAALDPLAAAANPERAARKGLVDLL